MSRLKQLTISALVLCALGCSKSERAPGQQPIDKDELTRGAQPEQPGEATYRRYCTPCHGNDGRGNNGVTGANFISDKAVLSAKSDAELETSVRDGKRGQRAIMPAHKPVLNDAQIHDAVAYVRKRFFESTAQ